MSGLKVGGLALIIKSVFPENVGKTVRLVNHIPDYLHRGLKKRVNCWETNPLSGKIFGINKIGEMIEVTSGILPSEHLMPLDDMEFTEEVLDKELEVE